MIRCMLRGAVAAGLAALVALALFAVQRAQPRADAAGPQPLSLHPKNRHYFLFRGKPAILVGSGVYGAVVHRDFDYVVYLNEDESARILLEIRRQGIDKPIIGETVLPSQRVIELVRSNAIRITGLDETSRAREAGLRVGDVVLRHGDRRVRNFDDLLAAVQSSDPAGRVSLEVLRDGATVVLEVPGGRMGAEASNHRVEVR